MQTDDPLDSDLLADAWRTSLDTFAVRASKHAWIPYAWVEFIARILSVLLLQPGARICVSAPPRHGKSLTIAHWLPVWFLDMFPEARVILGSYALKLARKHSRHVRDEFIRNACGQLWTRVDPHKRAAAEWYTTRNGGMMAAGVGTGITGFGFNLGIVDDPYKDWAAAMSPTIRQGVIDWFDSTFYTRQEPGAAILVVHTRWHQRDLIGYLLTEHQDEWIEIKMPAIAEGDDLLGRMVGEPLCAERYPIGALQALQSGMLPQMFSSLYQQSPTPAGGSIIKNEWVRYWWVGDVEPPPVITVDSNGAEFTCEQTQLPVKFDKIITSWDATFKDKLTSDYVAGHVWASSDVDSFLLDRVHDQLSFVDTAVAMVAMADAWPEALIHYVEDAANGPALKSSLGVRPTPADPGRLYLPNIQLEPTKGVSKGLRLMRASVRFKTGTVYLPHPAQFPYAAEVREQITSYPAVAHDDDCDALSQGVKCLHDDTEQTDDGWCLV